MRFGSESRAEYKGPGPSPGLLKDLKDSDLLIISKDRSSYIKLLIVSVCVVLESWVWSSV